MTQVSESTTTIIEKKVANDLNLLKITISEEQRQLSKVCKKSIIDSKLSILLDWYAMVDSITYTKFWKEFQITDFRIAVNTVSIEHIENVELKSRVSKMFKGKTHVYSKTDGVFFILFDEKNELRLELSKKKIFECFGQVNLLIASFGVKPEDVKLSYKSSSLIASHNAKAIEGANKLLAEGKFGDFVTGTKQANRVVRKGTEIIKNRA